MGAWYIKVLWLHIGCVIASGSLFFVRGIMMLADKPAANHPALRRISVLIDTVLLSAAIALTIMTNQYPFVKAWLTVKVLVLILYIALGIFALRRGRTRASRAAYFAAACVAFLFIVSVARTHNPIGFFSGSY